MASLVILRWVASYDHVCVEAIAGPLFKNYSVILKGPNKTIELKKWLEAVHVSLDHGHPKENIEMKSNLLKIL